MESACVMHSSIDSTPLSRQSDRSYPAGPGQPYASAPFGGDPFSPGGLCESLFAGDTDDIPHLYLIAVIELYAVYHRKKGVSIVSHENVRIGKTFVIKLPFRR